LDEHARRLVAASKAVELGYGGISRVSRARGLSRVMLTKGIEELQAAPLVGGRIGHEGGHALTSNDPGLAPTLDGLVEPTTRGDLSAGIPVQLVAPTWGDSLRSTAFPKTLNSAKKKEPACDGQSRSDLTKPWD
jgi:hypothetical protein